MNNPREEEFKWLEVELSDVVFLLRRHFWILITAPVLGLAAAVAVAINLPPVYKAEALFYIRPNFDQDLRVAHANTRLDDDDSLRSIAEVFVSNAVILRMVERLNLRNDESFLPVIKEKGPLSDLQLVKEIEDRYQTKLRPTTRLVELHVEDYSPQRATEICRVLSEEFLKYMREDRLAKEKDVREILVKQAETTLQHTLESEEKLKKFRTEHPDTLVEQDSNAFHQRILEQSSARNLANSERLRLEGMLTALENINAAEDAQRVFQVLNQKENTYIPDLLTMSAAARSNMAEVRNKYTPTHPEYLAAESRMTDVEQSIKSYAEELKNGVKSEYLSALEKEKSLERQIESLKEQFIRFKSDSASFRGLKEEIDRNWNTHTQLQQRIMNLDIDPEVSPTFLTPVEHPLLPDKKAKPITLLWAAAGGLLGGLVALAVVFWKNRSGLPFTSGKQSEKMLHGIRLVTEIEFPTRGGTEEKIACLEKSSFIREVIIATRGNRIIHLTSAVESPGASMVSISYARLSAQHGLKTILITLGEVEPRGNIITTPDGLSMLNLSPEITLNFTTFSNGLKTLLKGFDRLVIDSSMLGDREARLAICEISSTTIVAVEGKGTHPRSCYQSFIEQVKSRTSYHATVYFDHPGQTAKPSAGEPQKRLWSRTPIRRLIHRTET